MRKNQKHEEQYLSKIYLSMILGSLFLVALLGYTAIVAKDGRMPVTDWLDPMLAGLTLLSILFIQVLLVMVWKYVNYPKLKVLFGNMLMFGQWAYIFGEVLSNTISIGEPPKDIGSLFEISGGALAFLVVLGMAILYIRSRNKSQKKVTIAFVFLTIFLFIGIIWWFTHPIDQSQPGAPQCIKGNPIYNLFHGPC